MDYYIDEIQDYLEILCQDHRKVNHNMLDTTDQEIFRSFARFQSEEHIRAITNKPGDCIVVVADYYGQRVLHQDDERMNNTLVLRFAKRAVFGQGNLTNSINEAVKIAMEVMFDFLNRMRNDANTQMCEELRDLDLANANWQPIDDMPWLESYYGWDLSIPYLAFMPAYDAAEWRSDETPLPAEPPPPGTSASDGKWQLLTRFKVGVGAAPMADGDTTYTNSLLANKYVVVFASGSKLPEYTEGITVERHITKEKAATNITFVGGVVANEIIEIYKYEVE